jgi:segregation and condensation protein B
MDISAQIEGLLFYKGEEITVKKLSELLSVSIEEIEQGLDSLTQSLAGRGLVLVRKDDSVILGIAGELSSLIESIRRDEITKELSKAALETLSIVLYKNGVARNEIDYIRGVNSSFILRNLLVRGLVERVLDTKDNRRVLYRPTFEALSHMGVASVEALPNYAEVSKQLEASMSTMTHND